MIFITLKNIKLRRVSLLWFVKRQYSNNQVQMNYRLVICDLQGTELKKKCILNAVGIGVHQSQKIKTSVIYKT